MKNNIAVIFGGINTEHEVSIVSARSIIQNLNQKKYNILPIKISRANHWQSLPNFLEKPQIQQFTDGKLDLAPFEPQTFTQRKIDVVFPVLHGPMGEDGTLQGLLEMFDIPYVGSGVLGSAICMDKVIQKQLCQQADIPITSFIWVSHFQWTKDSQQIITQTEKTIGYPCFIKPANQGSSVGVSKANTKKELKNAVIEAFKFDLKIIIEATVPQAREIECSILGNEKPQNSVLGEITPNNEFYDYNAKYIDGKSKDTIPAKLSDELTKKIKQTACKAYTILNCKGLARVDFLLQGDTDIFYLNEVNTMPGFTQISMYPKLWQHSGLEYSELLDQLINLAIKHHQNRSNLKMSYTPKSAWHKR